MADRTSTEEHQTGRAALLSLQATLALRRQHPNEPELWRTAHRRALALLTKATRNRTLVLELHAGAVHVDGDKVLAFRPDDRPFGHLRRAGIGELVLARTLDAATAEQFLRQLFALVDCDDLDAELTALLDTARLPGIELRAGADFEPAAARDQAVDWDILPPPAPSTAAIRALVDRDSNCNLPALTVRSLLDDAEDSDQLREILQRLMQRLLAANDIHSVCWLLNELDRLPQFEGAQAPLQSLANRHCDPDWMQSMLANGTNEELLELSALAMRLGDDFAAQFASCAAEMAHPLSQWLGELLGQPDEL